MKRRRVASHGLPGRSHEAIEHLEFALAKRPDLGPPRELLNRLRAARQP